MALRFDNNIFFHIPRCGGNYVRQILQRMLEGQAEFEELGEGHAFPMMLWPGQLTGTLISRRHRFCTYREPFSWYQSFFAYRQLKGWRPNHPLDKVAQSPDFETFVRKALKAYPYGWYSMLCHRTFPFMHNIVHIKNMKKYMNKIFERYPNAKWPEGFVDKNINAAGKGMELHVKQKKTIDLFYQTENRPFAAITTFYADKLWRP